ncbi:MAG: TetR/AcrR family transcriptional regulator [Mixta calida]|uniref:TetR/AcrR family transcriptional regulator n=1 Tax=Mixta calida TaxID=665913 RepID=UPI0016816D13|nr:TetR/AcrR family transcriptional regulator [Mixta calida]MDU4289752.1 TetR/AcrR family transcriptional regulator [Mixta calida]MDU4942424.1 TetR/AcrR family transcriptional regulator [Mixta calida]MDU5828174.1 TetR/AcrR family transcriptional regulator [Mixta calida]MDU6414057.1 TetR/AcrR family transcriptional regulator [Mixta calida]MDU6539121.1 TetR/AcrR family transcriptional regulator [Mixta calida]
MKENNVPAGRAPARRLSKAARRQQLLDTALLIVREENADRLTLGHLAVRAGVSKPVVYDHFPTRSALLIELYRWIDIERIRRFTEAISTTSRSFQETVQVLASAYIHCAADKTDEFHAVGAALAGSEEKAAVFQELLDNCVVMFVTVLTPHVNMTPEALHACCIGLVGAGEALSVALTRGRLNETEAVAAFASLIKGLEQTNES